MLKGQPVTLEVENAVRVLDDGSIGRAGSQATGIGAMHTLVFPHEPAERAVFGSVLVKPDEVVIVPGRIGHGLVSVVKGGFAKRVTVPFEACHLARLAADTGGHVN